MPLLRVQLNHPGSQKPFREGNGYREWNGRIIREWNDDGTHYRKFIRHKGSFLKSKDDKEVFTSELDFWGEWEGNSFFTPISNSQTRRFPNGVHRPIHSCEIQGGQNTDPYVYGNRFKYAGCKQTGKLQEMEKGSLVLFGSTFPAMGVFYLDTVFVVGGYRTATEVHQEDASTESRIFREETLEQIDPYLKNEPIPSYKLYRGQSWWDDPSFFSFVPCRPSKDDQGFERLALNIQEKPLYLSSNPQVKYYLGKAPSNPKEVWDLVVNEAQKQGFYLGVHFNEPEIMDLGLSESEQVSSTGGCSSGSC